MNFNYIHNVAEDRQSQINRELGLICEASIAQQRGLMKEIQRRREAGEPAMTDKEKAEFLGKEEVSSGVWYFKGIFEVYYKIGNNVPWQKMMREDIHRHIALWPSVRQTETVQHVLDKQITTGFRCISMDYIVDDEKIANAIANYNHNLGIHYTDINQISVDVYLGEDPVIPDKIEDMKWGDPNRPKAYRVLASNEYETKNVSNRIKKLRTDMIGLFYEQTKAGDVDAQAKAVISDYSDGASFLFGTGYPIHRQIVF